MSGLAASSNVIYISSNSQLKCYRAYPLPTMTTKTTYLTYPGGEIYSTRDIAFEDDYDAGVIWVANGYPGKPVQAINVSGTCVDYVASSVIPSANGLTFDDEGYLWVSSCSDNTIYKVNVFETALENSTWGSIKAIAI